MLTLGSAGSHHFGGEELLHAALQLRGPKLLAETWPSLVSVKDEEVVKAPISLMNGESRGDEWMVIGGELCT